jgi:hypothetical protein
MIEIQCPRCKQYWYSNERQVGRARLCERCVDYLRRKRGPRAEIDIPFLIGVGMFLVFDLMLIAVTALMPEVFGKVLLIFGLLFWIAGWVTLRVLGVQGGLYGWLYPFGGDIDWRIGRWALLMVLSALALIAAYGTFLGFSR